MNTSAYAIAILLLIHGAISLAQATGGGGVANPGFLSWWPTRLGESWLPFETIMHSVGRLLWLASGVTILAAGLGLLGVLVPRESWRTLAVVGATVALPVLLAELHPFYLPVTILNVGIVVGLFWLRWPSVAALGA